MPFLVNANSSDFAQEHEWIFDGPFNDFIPLWYRVVGYSIVQTMIFIIFIDVILQALGDFI